LRKVCDGDINSKWFDNMNVRRFLATPFQRGEYLKGSTQKLIAKFAAAQLLSLAFRSYILSLSFW